MQVFTKEIDLFNEINNSDCGRKATPTEKESIIRYYNKNLKSNLRVAKVMYFILYCISILLFIGAMSNIYDTGNVGRADIIKFIIVTITVVTSIITYMRFKDGSKQVCEIKEDRCTLYDVTCIDAIHTTDGDNSTCIYWCKLQLNDGTILKYKHSIYAKDVNGYKYANRNDIVVNRKMIICSFDKYKKVDLIDIMNK